MLAIFLFFLIFLNLGKEIGCYLLDLHKDDNSFYILHKKIQAEDIKKGYKNTQKNYTKKILMTQKHDGVITHLEPYILEYEIKWALGNITVNKVSGGDEIPVELFQIL